MLSIFAIKGPSLRSSVEDKILDWLVLHHPGTDVVGTKLFARHVRIEQSLVPHHVLEVVATPFGVIAPLDVVMAEEF